jgi:hypothetical protein
MIYPHLAYQGPAYADELHPTDSEPTRELASRTSDGIHVRLLWHPTDGHVSVAVRDCKSGEAFEVPVGPRERARDVYQHPYAYAVMA